MKVLFADNHLEDDEIALLCDALKTNTTLTALNLHSRRADLVVN